MTRVVARLLAGALVCCSIPGPLLAQDVEQPAPTIRDIRVTGAHELSAADIAEAARVVAGRPLPVPVDRVDDLAARVVRQYRDEGYTFATVTATFNPASGVLEFTINEGVIDGVEFTGVDDRLKRVFAEEFALRAGDVFNRSRARQALDVLLRPTRGAVRPGRVSAGTTFTDSDQVSHRRGSFDLVDRNGQNILLVGLYEPAGRFKLVPDLGDREDWFSSVDGFVPSFGFGAAVFDHNEFNHAYVAGHLSYKFAAERIGWSLGFERPFFKDRKLYLGGELHDFTATDDQWQLSSLESSLAAVGARRSFRDYYRRRGIQMTAAFRPYSRLEVFGVWRGERHEPLAVTSDFSFANSDEAFRPNRPASNGRLYGLVVGASLDGGGFDRESLDATYRRHQLDTFFGERLNDPDHPEGGKHSTSAIWRVDWSSEITSPDAFASDYDFRRHIISARYRVPLSEHQEFGARGIGGWSGGLLPPERLFGIGGVGSVHGYDFKEQVGNSIALLNLEYALGWRGGLKGWGFFDAGHVGALQTGQSSPWLTGVGFGVGIGDFRIDFGYKLHDVPSSLQVLLRLGRTF